LIDQRFPDFDSLRERAKARMPRLAFDFLDTGAGPELGVRRNAAAFDALELCPRFGDSPAETETGVELFGRHYAMPIGIAPMGLAALAWPGADEILAECAETAHIPYVLATGASMNIEKAARLAPETLWFQLYQMPGNESALVYDLIARAERAGAHVLVLTNDSAARPKRPRDIRNGLVPPFSLTPKMALQALAAPSWLADLARSGLPRFENMQPYLGKEKGAWASAAFAVREITGTFSWEQIARIRDRWPRALVVKGLTHPTDAEKAVAVGADGLWISNHGGRVFDPSPTTAGVLPAIVEQVGGRATILLDSGIRDGVDVVRARALGAKAAFAGRAFLFAVCALGRQGGEHITELFHNDMVNTLKFLGAPNFDALNADIFGPPKQERPE
jgi:L-lactate dehydrogenase (cytochrome)